MNLLLFLGELGAAGESFGEPLVPIGTVYDPFVLRGLDAFVYSLYAGSRCVVVGTPAGVALGYEGGAHQSIVTPSVGTELPEVTFMELAYATAVGWTLRDAVRRVLVPDGDSTCLRLSTWPVDQSSFESLRAEVVHLVGSGTVLPEVLEAAALLSGEGVAANVVDVTSADLLFHAWRRSFVGAVSTAGVPRSPAHVARLFPEDQRRAPIVTVHDGAPHTPRFLGSIFGAPVVSLGVDAFGQVGIVSDLYRHFRLDAQAIVNAALVALFGPGS